MQSAGKQVLGPMYCGRGMYGPMGSMCAASYMNRGMKKRYEKIALKIAATDTSVKGMKKIGGEGV